MAYSKSKTYLLTPQKFYYALCRKLPCAIQSEFKNKLKLFLKNSKHPSLRIHRLKGKLSFACSLSVNRKTRALFISKRGLAEFFTIGSHDDVY